MNQWIRVVFKLILWLLTCYFLAHAAIYFGAILTVSFLDSILPKPQSLEGIGVVMILGTLGAAAGSVAGLVFVGGLAIGLALFCMKL